MFVVPVTAKQGQSPLQQRVEKPGARCRGWRQQQKQKQQSANAGQVAGPWTEIACCMALLLIMAKVNCCEATGARRAVPWNYQMHLQM